MQKVDETVVTDYYEIIKEPMWLNKMKDKLDNNQ